MKMHCLISVFPSYVTLYCYYIYFFSFNNNNNFFLDDNRTIQQSYDQIICLLISQYLEKSCLSLSDELLLLQFK